jgi:hypothetical protein
MENDAGFRSPDFGGWGSYVLFLIPRLAVSKRWQPAVGLKTSINQIRG